MEMAKYPLNHSVHGSMIEYIKLSSSLLYHIKSLLPDYNFDTGKAFDFPRLFLVYRSQSLFCTLPPQRLYKVYNGYKIRAPLALATNFILCSKVKLKFISDLFLIPLVVKELDQQLCLIML